MSASLNPKEAIDYHKALSPPVVNEAADKFMSVTPDERDLLIFYITFYNTQMTKRIAQHLGINVMSLGDAVEEINSQ